MVVLPNVLRDFVTIEVLRTPNLTHNYSGSGMLHLYKTPFRGWMQDMWQTNI